ncbi:hypothetical protein HK101_003385 [Irineochytrium annulatum]|nr:hypothetical protein HK101_003385 [Irineochytrium annulatum]
MRRALEVAGVDPHEVDYVNAHATSTEAGDLAEMRAVGNVFGGDRVGGRLRVSSTKGAVGHLLGAAGAVEAIFAILALHHNVIPPTRNLEQVDPAIELPGGIELPATAVDVSGDGRGVRLPQTRAPNKKDAAGLRATTIALSSLVAYAIPTMPRSTRKQQEPSTTPIPPPSSTPETILPGPTLTPIEPAPSPSTAVLESFLESTAALGTVVVTPLTSSAPLVVVSPSTPALAVVSATVYITPANPSTGSDNAVSASGAASAGDHGSAILIALLVVGLIIGVGMATYALWKKHKKKGGDIDGFKAMGETVKWPVKREGRETWFSTSGRDLGEKGAPAARGWETYNRMFKAQEEMDKTVRQSMPGSKSVQVAGEQSPRPEKGSRETAQWDY